MDESIVLEMSDGELVLVAVFARLEDAAEYAAWRRCNGDTVWVDTAEEIPAAALATAGGR